ncbi:hypothetical protein ACFOY4_43340 [Actinomadura syzygii]|uniref:Uncharacterized protein n=1 Tax=Actinomadura syzygii TaxID=1427538 RepID=A0A5D0TSS3_9ACTN|nr:hypothetical protein [Actinomadura syzygii]TYC07899.1 hypothetical protein FXF65_40930 [Actinomadura syzygii]
MSALLARLIDDAALFPPKPVPPGSVPRGRVRQERVPLDEALPTYRRAARHPAAGRFLCPASRFAELRARLVPEDLLDLGLVADSGIEDLSATLDAARGEPRVRVSALRVPLPGDADQARAAAVTIARLPPDAPAHIEVRPSPGWRDALDRVAAARDRGAPLGAAFHTSGAVEGLAAFISACAERDLPFVLAGGQDGPGPGPLNALLAAAVAGTGAGDVRDALSRTDPGDVITDLLTLGEDEADGARRLLSAYGTPEIEAALSALRPMSITG